MFQKNALQIALTLVMVTTASFVIADTSTVYGEGRVSAGSGDAMSIRNAAKQDAIRDAVVKAIKDATALNAADPRFAPIINEVAKQLSDVEIREERREGTEFVTRIEAIVDRVQIKNAIRGTELDKLNDRSFAILMLVDEFLTSTQDLKIPVRELEEISYDAGSSFRDKSLKANSAAASSKSAVAASSSVNATSASSNKLNASSSGALAAHSTSPYDNDSLAASQHSKLNAQSSSAGALSAKGSYASANAAQSTKASVDKKDVSADSHERMSYKRLVEYQDASKPEKKSIFLNEFAGKIRAYDLKLLDASIARSKFFGDKPITLSALADGDQMAKFSEYARTKANADILLMGSATIVYGGKNEATDQVTCSVSATVKAFATGGGELIYSLAKGTQASGMNIESCAAAAAGKIAAIMAPEFAEGSLGYWADRAARGRQFTVELKGKEISLPMRIAFAKALRDIEGTTDIEKKEDGADGVKVTMTMKGKADAMEQVYTAVSSQGVFASKTLDGTVAGEMITLCIDKCPPDATAPVEQAKVKSTPARTSATAPKAKKK
jgi:hypothetical protein